MTARRSPRTLEFFAASLEGFFKPKLKKAKFSKLKRSHPAKFQLQVSLRTLSRTAFTEITVMFWPGFGHLRCTARPLRPAGTSYAFTCGWTAWAISTRTQNHAHTLGIVPKSAGMRPVNWPTSSTVKVHSVGSLGSSSTTKSPRPATSVSSPSTSWASAGASGGKSPTWCTRILVSMLRLSMRNNDSLLKNGLFEIENYATV